MAAGTEKVGETEKSGTVYFARAFRMLWAFFGLTPLEAAKSVKKEHALAKIGARRGRLLPFTVPLDSLRAGYECGEGAPGQRLRQASPFRHDSEADSSSPRRAVTRPALQSFERPGALGRRPAAPLRKNARFVETRCQSTFTRRCMRLRSLKSQPDCCSLPYALCPRQPTRRFRTPSLVIDGRARRAG